MNCGCGGWCDEFVKFNTAMCPLRWPPYEDDLDVIIAEKRPKLLLGVFTARYDGMTVPIKSKALKISFGPACPEERFLCWVDKTGTQRMAYPLTCDVPSIVLQSLAVKHFEVILACRVLVQGELYFYVYISERMCVTLNYAAQPWMNRFRPQVQTVVQYFRNLQIQIYNDAVIQEENHIENIYGRIQNCYNPEKKLPDISHEGLKHSLREYQSQAVHWMLKQERRESRETRKMPDDDDDDCHTLFHEITLIDGSTVYYHKYSGFFTMWRYVAEPPVRGGILADEMGLGKSVEVLACILLNPRSAATGDVSYDAIKHRASYRDRYFSSNAYSSVKPRRKRQLKDKEIGNPQMKNGFLKERFECVCGSLNGDVPRKKKLKSEILKCEKCGLMQHVGCVLYRPPYSTENYVCPYCWVSSQELILSRATLIVTPASILYQWEREINKHVAKNTLKIFRYLGVEKQKFVHPAILSECDIVLTSYETFRRELSHVNLPHGKNRRVLRHPKKFMAIPSPLCSIHWWRICLDEAQLVESATNLPSKMVAKLYAVNRWCITGTPFQKSVDDLYGLLRFLGYDPYCDKIWWKELLVKPFANRNYGNLTYVMNEILWRTSKKDVLSQMGIVEPINIVHKLSLRQVELVFYGNKLANSKTDFIDNVRKYNLEKATLRSLDKQLLSKIMQPLKSLLQACSHFQCVQSSGGSVVQRRAMTTEELLVKLIRNSRNDCEETHRKLISSMNGLAGLYNIQPNFKFACDTYQQVLASVDENKENIRTDALQQIHALYNLCQVISSFKEKAPDEVSQLYDINAIKFTLEELKSSVQELSHLYLLKYVSPIQFYRDALMQITHEISQLMSNFHLPNKWSEPTYWWQVMFSFIQDDEKKAFIDRIKSVLLDAPGRNFTGMSVADSFQDLSGLSFVMTGMCTELRNARAALLASLEAIPGSPSREMVHSVVHCHLRSGIRSQVCVLCKADQYFNFYESRLFRFEQSPTFLPAIPGTSLPRLRQGTHSDSEYEILLKFCVSYRGNVSKEVTDLIEDGQNELKLIDAMKREFKCLRRLWIGISDYVGGIDELDMAKTAYQLSVDPNSPADSASNFIRPDEVDSFIMQHKRDIQIAKAELKNKLGHLSYLKNLELSDKDCPICSMKLSSAWYVFLCGHCACVTCMQALQLHDSKLNNNNGYTRCPVCREFTFNTNIHLIEEEQNTFDDVEIQGSFSTKVTGIVQALIRIQEIEPGAKCLVFSSIPEFLRIVECALDTNGLQYLSLSCRKKHFESNLQKFKRDSTINILLLPLNAGSNGLNITEAQHVLIAEPILDGSKILQAIGRVYRIGQRKQCTVHRFVTRATIEENINIFYQRDDQDSQPQTVEDLNALFTVL